MEKIIWIVTSDANLRLKLPGLLQPLGYAVRLFKLAKSALRTLERENPPTAILIESAALDMLAKLREKPKNVHLPVIVIASEGGEALAEHVQRLGADGFLSKPVTTSALERTLQAAFQRRRAMAG